MSTPNRPNQGFTLMDLLPGFTLIISPVAGLFGSRHHGLTGAGLGLAGGLLVGATGFFLGRGLIFTIEAICERYPCESPDSEDNWGCAAAFGLLSLVLMLTAIAPCSAAIASNLVTWMYRH